MQVQVSFKLFQLVTVFDLGFLDWPADVASMGFEHVCKVFFSDITEHSLMFNLLREL